MNDLYVMAYTKVTEILTTCQFFFIVGFKIFSFILHQYPEIINFDGKVNKDHNDDT